MNASMQIETQLFEAVKSALPKIKNLGTLNGIIDLNFSFGANGI